MSRSPLTKATIWSTTDLVVRQSTQLLFSIALARLLGPSDFGILAPLYLFTMVAAGLVDSGFASALIRDRQAGNAAESTVFYYNLSVAAAIALLLAAVSPLIAAYYRQPEMKGVLIWLAVNLVVAACAATPVAVLTKRLDFKRQAIVGSLAICCGGTVALWMASSGYGYRALVAQLFITSLVTTIGMFVASGWRPSLVFRRDVLKRYFNFGAFLVLSGVLSAAAASASPTVLARREGVSVAGSYGLADRLQQIVSNLIAVCAYRVTFPHLSSFGSQTDRLGQSAWHSMRILILLTVPVAIGLLCVAEPLVLAIFGSKWLASVVVLQVLSVRVLFWPVEVMNATVLTSLGLTFKLFRLDVMKRSITIGAIVFGARWGMNGVAAAVAASSILGWAWNAAAVGRHVDAGLALQARELLRLAAPALAMAVTLSAILHWLSKWPIPAIGVSLVLGGLAYCVVVLLSPSHRRLLAGVVAGFRTTPAVARPIDATPWDTRMP